MDQNLVMVLGAAAVVLAVVLGVVMMRRRTHSRRLQGAFGSEYDRAVSERGRSRAEKELHERKVRFERAQLRELSQDDRTRYGDTWRSIQSRFVDSPSAAVADADQLVSEVMRMRGYPAGDFDQRLADVAIGHPSLVEHYRSAHHIAGRSQRGETNTEELRQALVHYRALFEELLAPGAARESEAEARTRFRTRPA